MRLIYGQDASGKASGCPNNSRYFCRIMGKVINHMHVRFCCGDGKSPGHTLIIFYRMRKGRRLTSEILAYAERSAQVFKIVLSGKRQMILSAAPE